MFSVIGKEGNMMDKVFEKIGIYDIMGLWMPGVIITTYGVLTLEPIVVWLYKTLKIASYNLEHDAIYVLLFTVVAYTVGSVLHELGKILFDATNSFNLRNISYFPDEVKCEEKNGKEGTDDQTNQDGKKGQSEHAIFRNSLNIIKQIQREYNEEIDAVTKDGKCLSELLNNKDFVTLPMANSVLSYNEERASKIGKVHALYGLSRSLVVGFAIHLVIVVVAIVVGMDMSVWFLRVAVDVVLICLFAIRTYRYVLSYARNRYIQYFLCAWKNDEIKQDKKDAANN